MRLQTGASFVVAMLVISLFFISPSFGSLNASVSMNLTGSIFSTGSSLLLGAGHPAWAYDHNGNPVNIQLLVNLAAASGANSWREAMYVGSSISGYYANLKSYCDQAGLKFVIQTLSASVGAMTYQQENNIIQNIDGAQAPWINGWGSKISQLHPYAIMVMNEPTNNGAFSTASTAQFAYYRQFCINAISAWRAIDPNIVIIVQNDPFNDAFDSTSFGFAVNPLPFSNILYGRHVYYSYDNTYPASYQPEQRAYWTAKTPQDLANAKQLLTNVLISESSALTIEGQQVIWDEWGANVNAPNSAVFTKDFISITRSLNIGNIYYDFVPSSYEPVGLLNDDYQTLNTVGQAWASSLK